MGVRENKVEKYLDKEMRRLGGLSRKWVSPGRDGVPDRICILDGHVWFIEIKTVDGKASPVQIREQLRLSLAGAQVKTLYGEKQVDDFIKFEVEPLVKLELK